MSQQPCLPVPKKRKRHNDDDHARGFDQVDRLDAGEYLRRVVEEANALPQVFASGESNHNVKKKLRENNNDNTYVGGLVASVSYLTSHGVALYPPPTPRHAATRAWVDTMLYNFSQLRSYLEQCQMYGVGGKGTNRLPLPALKDRPGWHVFCVGPSEARGNSNSYFGDDDSTDSKNQSDSGNSEEEIAVEPWKQQLPQDGYTPTVSLVLQMDQVMVRRVLSHLIHYVTEGWTVTAKSRVEWIYSLLARLERPIHREDAALLHKLLKHLTSTRAKLKTENFDASQLARLNLLISVIGIYFEQGGGYAALMEANREL